MCIPARFAPVLFSALLSAIMVCRIAESSQPGERGKFRRLPDLIRARYSGIVGSIPKASRPACSAITSMSKTVCAAMVCTSRWMRCIGSLM